jgi:hypothetical protein
MKKLAYYSGCSTDVFLIKDDIIEIINFNNVVSRHKFDIVDVVERKDNTVTEVLSPVESLKTFCYDFDTSKIVTKQIKYMFIHKNLKHVKKISFYNRKGFFKFKPFVVSNKNSLFITNEKNEIEENVNILQIKNSRMFNLNLLQSLNDDTQFNFENEYELTPKLGFIIGAWLAFGNCVFFDEYNEVITFPNTKDHEFIINQLNNIPGFTISIKENQGNTKSIFIINDFFQKWINKNFVIFPKKKILKKDIYRIYKTIPNWVLSCEKEFIENILIGLIKFSGKITKDKIIIQTQSKSLANRITTLLKFKFEIFYFIKKNETDNETTYEIELFYNNNLIDILYYYKELKELDDLDLEIENLEPNYCLNFTTFQDINITEEKISTLFNFELENKFKNFLNIDGIVIKSNSCIDI